MRYGAGLAFFLLVLACAPAADAAQRYAAPGGTGSECSQAKPCSLNEAMGEAKAADEVIITAGTYSLSASAMLSSKATGANVHGDFDGPRPTITATIPGAALIVFATQSRLSYVDVTNTDEAAAGVVCGSDATVERVLIKSVSKNGQGLLQFGNCSVRDSVIRAQGSEVVGLLSGCEETMTTRNVTVLASGVKATGIRTAYNGLQLGGSCTLDLRNAIVSGDQYDLQSTGGFGPANISVEHSSFDVVKQEPSTTITQGAGNQTAPPLFVDAAKGDYREAAGSPTIDAGISSLIGTLDPDGNARVLGPGPDIGAYEFVPPALQPPAPGQIQSLSLAPRKFRTVNAGEAIFSARKKAKAPIGTTVTYTLSGKATTEFFVEQRIVGRKVNGKCKARVTKPDRKKKKCAITRLNKTGFAHSGQAGQNQFKFSGRLGGVALKPGAYRMIAGTSTAKSVADFTIVR